MVDGNCDLFVGCYLIIGSWEVVGRQRSVVAGVGFGPRSIISENYPAATLLVSGCGSMWSV